MELEGFGELGAAALVDAAGIDPNVFESIDASFITAALDLGEAFLVGGKRFAGVSHVTKQHFILSLPTYGRGCHNGFLEWQSQRSSRAEGFWY
jgi:hypothetical protein